MNVATATLWLFYLVFFYHGFFTKFTRGLTAKKVNERVIKSAFAEHQSFKGWSCSKSVSHYPLDTSINFDSTCPLDSDLSSR